MKHYDGTNFPTHWELIRPLEQSSPHSKSISFRRSWNFEESCWDIQTWGAPTIHRTIGQIKNHGYMEGKPMYRHSLQEAHQLEVYQCIEDAERDLLDHFLLIEEL